MQSIHFIITIVGLLLFYLVGRYDGYKHGWIFKKKDPEKEAQDIYKKK